MTDTKQAIEKAIMAGWLSKWSVDREKPFVQIGLDTEVYWTTANGKRQMVGRYQEFLLDPSFWQALEKALGWENKDTFPHLNWMKEPQDEWQFHQHRLIDHIQDGKGIESYFRELLK